MVILSLFFNTGKISAAPQLLSLNPGSAGQGVVAKNISVNGTGFQCGATVSFSDPSVSTSKVSLDPVTRLATDLFNNQCASGTISSNVQFFSSNNVFIYVDVSSSAPLGPVTLTFTNPDNSVTTGTLNINPAPVICSVTPSSTPGVCPQPSLVPTVLQGGTITLQMNGTGFQNGAILTGSFTVNSLYVNANGTMATANVTVSPTANPSLSSVTLTNPDGGRSSFSSAYQVQWGLNSITPAMAVYEDPRLSNGNRTPFDLFWNGGWSDEGNIIPYPNPFSILVNYTPTKVILKPHPFLFQQVEGHHVNTDLDLQVWNNSSWGGQMVVQTGGVTQNFDMAYESQSGNGMAVYGTGTGLAYRQIFQNLASCPAPSIVAPCWSQETPISTLVNGSNPYIYTVKLMANPDPLKNEILLAYLDSTGRLFVRLWNGSSFSPEVQLTTTARVDLSSFDLAYMQTSKSGMLAWLESGNGVPQSCLWNGVSCLKTNPLPFQTGTTSTTTSKFRILLSADPFSDKIALGTVELYANASILKTEIWDGTTWPTMVYPASLKAVYQQSNSLSRLDLTTDGLNFSLVWKQGNGGSRLFSIYTQQAGGLHYQIWDPVLGWNGVNGDFAVPGILGDTSGILPYFNSIVFDSDPRSGDILGGMKSIDSLFASVRWDGASSQWVEYKALTPLITNSNLIPFGISYFKNFPTIDPAIPSITGQQGSVLTFSINGSHFQSGAAVSAVKNGLPALTPAGQPVFSQTSSTVIGNSLLITGAIASDAIPDSYDLQITNPDRTLVIGNRLISITALAGKPVIYSVTPNNRGQNALNQTLILSGYNLTSSFSLSFILPNGGVDPNIVVTTPQPLTPVTVGQIQQVILQLDILSSASQGSRDLLIHMGGQSYSFKGLFSVNFGPSILNITPTTLSQGTTQNIVVTGNDFQGGAQIVIPNGTQTLGWNTPGGTYSNLYQNKMTGNRFAFPPGSARYVLVAQASILTPLVDPSQVNGQAAIYDDNGGVPGNLISTGLITPLNQSLCWDSLNQTAKQACALSFNAFPPVILDTTQKYWILFNVEGFQTVVAYDSNQPTCDGDSTCISVSAPYTFGSWPNPGSGGTGPAIPWNPVSGGRANRYAINLLYQPVVGSPQKGVLAGGAYNQITGSNTLTLNSTTSLKGIFVSVGSVDPVNQSASLAIYDSAGTGGAPGNVIVSGKIISKLAPNSFNLFPMSSNFSLPAGTYWILTNANGAGTTLNYDSGGTLIESAVQFAQTYGTGNSWPSFPAVSLIPKVRYSSFGIGSFPPVLGSASGAVTDGPDSNQMTGSQFLTTLDAYLVGLSFYVDTVDPLNPLGSAAIYDDNNGMPGNLKAASAPQTLNPNGWNNFTVPLTHLSPGKYWLMVNVNGRGTTLTYDDGTSGNSGKKLSSFVNGWPSSGGSTGWTITNGRRYAVGVIPDVMINNPYVNSSNVVTGGISIDPSASLTGRQICILNPDGGMACGQVTLSIVPGIKTNIGMTSYGSTSLSPYPAYRLWPGYPPWNYETTAQASAGGGVNGTVLRAYPNLHLPTLLTARPDEKILGTISNANLTLQVWNGSAWGASFTANPSPSFSRSFDIVYESLSGRAVAVYGVSGNGIPQYQIWDGSAWTSLGGVSGGTDIKNTVLSVRLEPNPASNEIILAYLSGVINPDGSVTNVVLHSLVWSGNGNTFGTEGAQGAPFPITAPAAGNINLCLTCTPPVIGEMFDIAYEQAPQGKGIVSWGVSSSGSSTPSYALWNGTVWSGVLNANRAAGDAGTPLIYLKMSADPGSKRIAMGTGTINGQYYSQVWNGTDWGSPAARYDLTTNPTFSLTGEWASTPVTLPSVGSQKVSFVMSDSASFTIPGNEVDLIGQKESYLGIANIYLDGILKDRIDFYSPLPSEKMVLYTLSGISNASPHVLSIKPSGSKNVHAFFPGGSQVDSSVANQIVGSVFKAPFDTTLSRLAVFLNTADSVNSAIWIGVYSDNGGFPGNLLGEAISPTGLPGVWNSLTVDPTFSPNGIKLTGGTSYWILASAAGSGTTFSFSNSTGNPSIKSVKLARSYTGALPQSFPANAPWIPIPSTYYSLNGGLSDGNIDYVSIGVAPSVSVDSADVYLNGINPPPSAVSADLLYNVDPLLGLKTDPQFNVGRNFDLAWEKDSGTLMTVFASSRSINSCAYTDQYGNSFDPFPYGTRFKRWDPAIDPATQFPVGWSSDALVPLVGRDLVPRRIQLIQEPASNDLFLEIIGNPVFVYNPTNPNVNVDHPFCIVAQKTGTNSSDPTMTQYHHYVWENRSWSDKEVLNLSSSGALQSFIGPYNSYTGYGESFMAAFNADGTPPAPVQDLVVTGVSGNTVSLQWISTGDDGNSGKAASYTIYYSTSASFTPSTALKVIPVYLTPPSVPEKQSATVNLPGSGTWYFSITAADRAGNSSTLSSSIVSATIISGGGGTSALAPITDLQVVSGSLSNNNVQLTWTAPLISPAYTGIGAAYDLRYCNTQDPTCSYPITDDLTFSRAHPLIATDGTGRNSLTPPHKAGTREIINFSSLSAGTTYFAIKSCGPVALNPATFRCDPSLNALSPADISLINSNGPVWVVNNSTGGGSSVLPSPITDLVALNPTGNTITLHWTVPSDAGSGAQYDIRYSPNSTPITAQNFNSLQVVARIPPPNPPGAVQSFVATNLVSSGSGVTYQFAIKTINSSGAVSGISNIASGTTLPVFDLTPPAPITDLTVVQGGINRSSVVLTWTATGDDGTLGTAMKYDIRYSAFPISNDTAFQSASSVTNPPLPLPSGNKEYFTVTGLDSNLVYYFAVKAIDKGGNLSGISICSNCPGHTALRSGYNLVSVPYRLTGAGDPASVFGNDVSRPVTIYQWNSGAYSVPALVSEGGGYFLYAAGNNSVLKASDSSGNLLPGAVPETSASVGIPLQSGWNIIGNPYLQPIYLKDACVKSGSGPSVPFETAALGMVIGNSIYSYDGTKYSAELYHDATPPPYNQPDARMDPWNGYWIQLYSSGSGYSLILMNGPGACP